jgi:hypothetical protein
MACLNLSKNEILAGSFKQVAGVTDLAPSDLNPSKLPYPSVLAKFYLVDPINSDVSPKSQAHNY